MFRSIWARSPLFLRQVKDMISCRDDNDKGLLIFAVESGRVEMRKAVMATISDMFAEQEVCRCTVGQQRRSSAIIYNTLSIFGSTPQYSWSVCI